jgi:hypothetical protein
MSAADLFESIVETYEKFGWVLRRAALTASTKAALSAELGRRGVTVTDAEIDGLWFSRPSDAEQTAWELRYLGEMPFALLEHLNEKDDDFETHLAETEARLTAAVHRKETA